MGFHVESDFREPSARRREQSRRPVDGRQRIPCPDGGERRNKSDPLVLGCQGVRTWRVHEPRPWQAPGGNPRPPQGGGPAGRAGHGGSQGSWGHRQGDVVDTPPADRHRTAEQERSRRWTKLMKKKSGRKNKIFHQIVHTEITFLTDIL